MSFTPFSQLVPRPKRSDDNPESRVLDLRLLHHYVAFACNDFPGVQDQQIRNLWSIMVPQMGFSHEFLLDAVLSSSAFHLSTLLSNDKKLEAIGHNYFGQALVKHREALSSIDPSTADPLCLVSVLIMFQTLKISGLGSAQERYFPPVEWFRIINGTGRLIKQSSSLVTGGGIKLLLRMQDLPVAGDRTPNDLPLVQNLSTLLLHTNKLCSDVTDATIRDGLQSFWNSIDLILKVALAGETKHRVRCHLLTLAATSEEKFLQLMEEKDPISLILLSHYFTLLKWAGGNWWLQSSLDSELSRLLSSIPNRYQWVKEHQVPDVTA
ncbi:hypothetical protein MMC10_002875 [Thelotrema lepadinum]|nr:hypothetical protein [Thelotrema lepadinum]